MTLIKSLRKFKRTVSVFFIVNIITELLIPLKAYSHSSQILSGGGGSPVAASTSSMVDGYTGDFRYSVPLVTVPGPNGESVPITAGYHAGIGVNQKASWIGLGWDYSPGEISRSVVGTPDDHNGKVVNDLYGSGGTINRSTTMFGAIYTKNIKTVPSLHHWKSNDFYTIYRHLPENKKRGMMAGMDYEQGQYSTDADKYRFNRYSIPFQAIAYDDYYVSGGLSGKIHPFTLGENKFHSDRPYADVSMAVNTNTVQFYFANSSSNTINTSTATNSLYVNTATNRIHSGTFVKYYTNTEINSSGNLFDNTTQKGFLDYRTVSGTRRPSADFDPDGIGGFEVTDVNGITYHYSLPVYIWDDRSFQVTGDMLIAYGSTEGHFANITEGQQRPDKYAKSWKLTAVTGADYQDENNNKMVDEGDSGYWINYNYSLWSNDYFSASQRFGCKEDGALMKNAPSYFSFFNGKTFKPSVYKRAVNLSKNHSQVYVLNYIQTASHTAFFVKSIRLDEQSYDNMAVSTDKPAPLLKLDRIILMENKNKACLINSTAMSSGDKDSRFSYATCTDALSDLNFIHITKYNSNINTIKSASLKSVEFMTDYTLAPKYVGNITNTVTYKPVKQTTSNVYFFNTLTGISNSSAQSGKLTLNKINFYELDGVKITPSVDFDYGVTDAEKNPDCDEDKTDLWGYYKKDYVNSHYVTDVSRNNVDAWSLREITTSLGSKIRIEYESDMYHSEGFLDDPDFIPIPNSLLGSPYTGGPIKTTMPHLIFPIASFNTSTSTYTMEAKDSYPYFNGLGRDLSIPFESHSNLIINYIDQCSRQLLYYDHGNQYTYTQPVQKLIHRGQHQAYNNAPGNSGIIPYTGTSAYVLGPHTMTYSYGNPIAEDFDLSPQCQVIGQTFSSSLAPDVVNFQAHFRSYLYGGGVRVKKIETIEPYKDLTYTQLFTYGKGYCPVVPKTMALCYGTAPNAYDLCVNFKPLINPQLNSRVGYDYMQTTTINEKGETNGSVKQFFANALIANPLAISSCSMIKGMTGLFPGNPVKIVGPCNYYTPVGSIDSHLYPNNYYFNMCLNRGDLFLGKAVQTLVLDASERIVSTTNYEYGGTSFVEEKNKPASSLSTLESFTFIRPNVCPSTGSPTPESSLFSFSYGEYYVYTFTYRFFNSPQLIGTTTIRDGIETTNRTPGIDPLTNSGTLTVSKDPTIGEIKTGMSYAYKDITDLGLKSVNENYKNQPALLLGTKTTKGKYVIAQSKVSYTKVYPTRIYDGTTSKYKNSNITKNWYRVDETYTRLLDDDVLATVTPSSTDWRKTSTGTMYDKEGNRIEEAGLNDRETASKWGYNNRYKLATISNANYNSFTFTGFEDQLTVNASPLTVHFGGEVINGQLRTALVAQPGGLPLIKPHTGTYMAAVANGVTGPKFNTENFEKGRTYVAKVWVYKNSPVSAALTVSLTGTTGTSTPLLLTSTVVRNSTANVTVGDWVLMSADITVPDNFNLALTHNLSVSLVNPSETTSVAYFDDLTFHPKDVVVTGNVYDEKNGLLMAQLDNENFATLYNYDNAGRILTTYKEYSGGTKKVTETSYHFAKP